MIGFAAQVAFCRFIWYSYEKHTGSCVMEGLAFPLYRMRALSDTRKECATWKIGK